MQPNKRHTSPSYSIEDTHPIYQKRANSSDTPDWLKPRRKIISCSLILLPFVMLCVVICIFLIIPFQTNILILGIDYAPHRSFIGRSDTIVFTTFNPNPLAPRVALLSIPRDLWVSLPLEGENRINTAHFFAESRQSGSGPYAVLETIKLNFGIELNYFMRFRFDSVRDLVDSMGGVDVYIEKLMAGYQPGWHHFTGKKALGFARNRRGTDDFFRMEQGQLLIKSIMVQSMRPEKWLRLPSVLLTFIQSAETNIPWWQIPRIAMAVFQVGIDGIDSQIVNRDMTTPFTTSEGANVLIPNWQLINPAINAMFKR